MSAMLQYRTFFKSFFLLGIFLLSFNSGQARKEEVVKISTRFGDIYVWLYKDTPKHRENFLKLAKNGTYDSTLFHRVIKGFMIQGGDPNTKPGNTGVPGEGGPGYTLEAEIVDKYYHRKGVLAAARKRDKINPEKKSSGSQFYIVQGRTIDSTKLMQLESQMAMKIEGFEFSDEAVKAYTTEGGAPWLDRQYTIFGEVIAGMDVVEKIAEVQVENSAMPTEDVFMTMEVIKMSKRKLRKEFGFEVPDN